MHRYVTRDFLPFTVRQPCRCLLKLLFHVCVCEYIYIFFFKHEFTVCCGIKSHDLKSKARVNCSLYITRYPLYVCSYMQPIHTYITRDLLLAELLQSLLVFALLFTLGCLWDGFIYIFTLSSTHHGVLCSFFFKTSMRGLHCKPR